MFIDHRLEGVTRGVLQKTMFLKVSQNSQENIKKETPPLAASVDRPLTKNVIPRIMKVKRDIYYPFK